MLIDYWKTPCVFLEKVRTADGMGGYITTWSTGAEFTAAIVKDDSIEALAAQKEGVTEVYTVTVDKTVSLDYHDVFKRLADNAVFRVTSTTTDSQTPSIASFSFAQVRAERWELS